MKTFLTALLCTVFLPLAAFAGAVEEILEKNAQALGGREALDKMKSFSKEGTIAIRPTAPDKPAMRGTTKAFFKAPDKASMTTTIGRQTQTKTTNGKIYWESDSAIAVGAHVISGAPAESRMEDARLDNTYLANYSNLKFSNPKDSIKIELLGTEKVGEREAYVVKLTRPYGNQTNVYLDKETGLVVKEQTAHSTMLPSDWRKVDGVMFPFKLTLIYRDANVEIVLDAVKVNPEIPDSVFELPANPSAP